MYGFCFGWLLIDSAGKENKIKVPKVILYNQKQKGHGNRLVIQATTSRGWATDFRCSR
jgi:hypothetical protein